MKKQILLTLILAASFLTSACSNPTSQKEREKDQLQATVNEKEATLTPLAGRYEGTLTSLDGLRIQNVVLILIPTIMIVQNPGRNDVTEMPTLGGSLNIYLREGDLTDVIPVAQFNNTIYNPNSGHIRLSGNMNTPGTLGNVLSTMDGNISGNNLKAHLTNSIRGDLGIVDVQRTQPQTP